mmetsp:Transcript_42326/g.99355  ORF Transcript_42326/g.99355 Transcript_42326/m.99355 type:complete len:214 (+) Transcript_42326:1224-1865(+)
MDPTSADMCSAVNPFLPRKLQLLPAAVRIFTSCGRFRRQARCKAVSSSTVCKSLSAPCSRRQDSASGLMCSTAACKGAWPRLSCAFRAAFACTSTLMVSSSSDMTARCSGVWRSCVVRQVTFALSCNSFAAASCSPALAAQCTGVIPKLSYASMRAPLATSTSTISSLCLQAAKCKGEAPSSSRVCTSHRLASSESKAAAWPSCTAILTGDSC